MSRTSLTGAGLGEPAYLTFDPLGALGHGLWSRRPLRAGGASRHALQDSAYATGRSYKVKDAMSYRWRR